MLKRIAIALAIAVAGALCLDAGGHVVAPGDLAIISTAEAVVGRPLTPMSVAGVTRRTARRCAAGVYNC
ncbi:MAG TPA: hypothetical protein VLV76_20250 [Candidatus Acidoferrum sp.]|nr:hypothetical protein [Candidatus Acidoferrum sp.]